MRGKGESDEPLPPPFGRVRRPLHYVPNPFEGTSFEERLEVMRKLGERADEKYRRIYFDLDKWFKKYDALYVLTYCMVYFLSSPGGIDKEAVDGKLDFATYHLELMQAISLMHVRSGEVEDLGDDAYLLHDEMKTLGEALVHLDYGQYANISTPEEARRVYVLDSIKGYTKFVRNYSNPDQIWNNTIQLTSRLGRDFLDKYGVEAPSIIKALMSLHEFFNSELFSHLETKAHIFKAGSFSEAWKSYKDSYEWDDTDEETAKKMFRTVGQDLDAFKAALIKYTDQIMPQTLVFSAADFALLYGDSAKEKELDIILKRWSYEFGDLSGENRDRFVLNNPVLQKPLIRIGEDYFFPLFGILPHLLPSFVESLVNDLRPASTEKFYKAKSNYLEESTENLFKSAFPGAQVVRGCIWRDPISGAEFENDVLVIVDRFAIVIENKSGKFDPPARRGGELRLIDTLKNFVVDAGVQANAFIKFLRAQAGAHQYETKQGEKVTIDTSNVGHYIPISVTYENLYTMPSNLKKCVEVGLIKTPEENIIPSFSLDDLAIVFDLLRNEVERIHYLSRRGEIEKDVEIEGDEMDLLAFYLESGFNLGEHEGSGQVAINLLMKSKEIDGYYTARELGVEVEKPTLQLTKWWRDILNRLIERKPESWTEAGFVLLNVPKEIQRDFERKFRNLAAKVRAGIAKDFHNLITLETAPKSRSYVIVGFPYSRNEYKERAQVISHALSPENVAPEKLGALCIGLAVEVEHDHYPYSVLAYERRSLIR